MIPAPPHPNETARLAALDACGILDSGDEAAFDDLCRLAALACDTSIALVSFVARDRQWFKARHGLMLRETPRDVSFCAHAILQDDGIFEVRDARTDPRFRDHPFVASGGIAFYAAAPLRLPTGEVLGTLCVVGDSPRELGQSQRATLEILARQIVQLIELRITRLRADALDAALTQTHKLATIGEMASSIVHEISNPLAIIAGKTSRARRMIATGEGQIVEAVETIERMTERITKIVQGVRNVAYDAGAEPGPARTVSAAGFVADALSLCRDRLHHQGIELRESGAERGDAVTGCPVQLSQIILNLVTNAADAIAGGPGGTRHWIAVEIRATGDRVEVRVSDSGPGIPEAIRSRVMSPFFTTKPVGKGTGLGLSISQGIARSHGGTLTLDEGAANTTFVLSLPAAPAEIRNPQATVA